ncbi:unnamed protein product [Calypogeia fissa]
MAYNPGGQPSAGMTVPAPVSSVYCVPYVAQFEIDQKVLTVSGGRFTIKDARGTLLFDVKHKNPLALHTRRVVYDASGNALVLLKRKMATMHERWSAYRGESDDSDSNMLFSMAKSSLIQLTPSYDIFLGTNKTSTPDFKVKGDIFQHHYSILYNGTPVAEVRKKVNMSSIFVGKDQYGVTVYPGVDHAFIASVIVIMDQVKQAATQGGD